MRARVGDGRFAPRGKVGEAQAQGQYSDGDLGVSFVFPLLIVAHVNAPMAGGYLVHRMYLKNHLEDFNWQITYMPSASRWMDT